MLELCAQLMVAQLGAVLAQIWTLHQQEDSNTNVVEVDYRGSGDDPPSDGRGRQGSRRLDGRRRAARGAVGHLSRHAPLLPPEFQPGHQPADRQLARAQRHDACARGSATSATSSTKAPSRARCCRCNRPIVLNAEFEAMRKYMGETACRIDCTFDARRAALDAMRQAFDRICQRGRGRRARAAACTSC